jgi:type IV/VI secretion system ImpK/VasF family protein
MSRLFEHFAPAFSFGLAIDRRIASGEWPGQLEDAQGQARALIEQARQHARADGKTPPAVDSAAFAVVAWLDELMMRYSPWRSRSSSLQLQLFNTHNASEEFFELLANLGHDDGEVREVYYHALLLGFAGQYYFDTSEHGELGKIRDFLSRLLPVAPLSLQSVREQGITPQPYDTEDPPAPRYPSSWDAWRMKIGAGVHHLHADKPHDIADAAQAPVDAEALKRMGAAIRYAKHALLHTPDADGERQPLYRTPWLLFLGDGDAHMADVLVAAGHATPLATPREDVSSSIWRWWLLPSMVAIETIPRFACKSSGEPERALWHQALIQLAHERERLPLNGIVVCVGAQTLLGDASVAADTGLRLRRLVDECMHELQLELPVYVLVTGLEQLPGYAVLSNALSIEALVQAIGWRLGEHPASDFDALACFDQQIAELIERLHALRLTLLAGERRMDGRRGVFDFVQSISGLHDGLRQFIGSLLEHRAAQHVPHWRGLYMVAGALPERRGGSFVADLFARFLPADQPLATPSVHVIARHRR